MKWMSSEEQEIAWLKFIFFGWTPLFAGAILFFVVSQPILATICILIMLVWLPLSLGIERFVHRKKVK
jgi:hypothetical protein